MVFHLLREGRFNTKENIMKKVLLGLVTLVALTQAADIVHYDKGGQKDQTSSKPNHPSTNLYK